ncbi:hypothetical protein [Dyadobacter sp. LHD-138]|nr:hypothetical protein [Dyadobacter sp. LHD-138]MDQ6479400.1 hypothetical protein [Dyadobacter sp. LHD-138]
MTTRDSDHKNKTGLWEVLIILLIWLLALSMVYIIFWKVKSNLN